MSEPLTCPDCGSSEVAGVEVRGVYDGVLYWMCMTCDWAWARWNDGLSDLSYSSNEYATAHNQERANG